jgi:hypothetical protein
MRNGEWGMGKDKSIHHWGYRGKIRKMGDESGLSLYEHDKISGDVDTLAII